jgi:multicomponent Na+:H+ antiporter subunit F
MTDMTLVLALCAVMLASAALLLLVRVTNGPTMLDRAIALDVLVSALIVALGIEAAANRHTTTLPILIVLSLLGFVGTVSVARFHQARGLDGAAPRSEDA